MPATLQPVLAVCPHCNTAFVKNHGRRLYCSKRCGDRASAERRTQTCSVDGCDKKFRAKGLCVTHYNQTCSPEQRHPVRLTTCAACGDSVVKRVHSPSGNEFCSYECRDLWRLEHPYTGQRTELPKDHPVRVLMRKQRLSPIRQAYEAQDWPELLSLLESRAVKVDGCWLWERTRAQDGYGHLVIAGRSFSTHRLALMASLGAPIPSHMPVHHKCAERSCMNPDHLQVVTPAENAAEMLERRHYLKRIAELEDALRVAAPNHPLL